MASKKETNTVPNAVQWPTVKAGRFVCSDGTEWTDGYHARLHQRTLNNQQSAPNKQ